MPGCAAVNCSNSNKKGFLMKVFPRNPERRQLWALKVRRANWKPKDSSFLCEEHFDKPQWENARIDGKRKLKQNAIPTLFNYAPPVKKKKASDLTGKKHDTDKYTKVKKTDKLKKNRQAGDFSKIGEIVHSCLALPASEIFQQQFFLKNVN